MASKFHSQAGVSCRLLKIEGPKIMHISPFIKCHPLLFQGLSCTFFDKWCACLVCCIFTAASSYAQGLGGSKQGDAGAAAEDAGGGEQHGPAGSTCLVAGLPVVPGYLSFLCS